MVLYQGYGQTEAVPVCMMGPEEWFSEVEGSEPLRSTGRALPFAYLQIRDPRTRPCELPIGDEGEIAVRCDGQMSGFWNDPEATASGMTVDGFVLTGDIGRLDANGYLYVLDRKDDMIISGGFNIWPAELENVIAEHPGVIEVGGVRRSRRALGRIADRGLHRRPREPPSRTDAGPSWRRYATSAPIGSVRTRSRHTCSCRRAVAEEPGRQDPAQDVA